MRRNDVASTSFRRRVATRFLINQCQIITFLILKYDITENSKIELRGIVLPVQVGGLLGGGGGTKGNVGPLSNIWGGGGWPPSSYAYAWNTPVSEHHVLNIGLPLTSLIDLIQSNFSGSNTFGTKKISSRQGWFGPIRVNYSARSGGLIGISFWNCLTRRYVMCSH